MTNRSRGSGSLLCTDPSNRKWCETASASQLFHGIRNWSFGRQSGIASSGHENEGSPAGNTNTVINLGSEGSHLERGSTPSHLFGGPVSKLGWNVSECFPAGSSLLTGHQNSTVSLSETGSNRRSAGNRTVFYPHIKVLDNTFPSYRVHMMTFSPLEISEMFLAKTGFPDTFSSSTSLPASLSSHTSSSSFLLFPSGGFWETHVMSLFAVARDNDWPWNCWNNPHSSSWRSGWCLSRGLIWEECKHQCKRHKTQTEISNFRYFWKLFSYMLWFSNMKWSGGKGLPFPSPRVWRRSFPAALTPPVDRAQSLLPGSSPVAVETDDSVGKAAAPETV